MQQKFGERVYKVSIDAGFTCPNRDGTKSFGGCIFCDDSGSSSRTHPQGSSIRDQIIQNILVRKKRYGAKKFIAYFQSYTNTYGKPSHLQKLYDEAIQSHPDIIGLSIATRADCVDEEKIAMIAEFKKKVPYVQIEYGMQTVHNRTLQKIRRNETHEDFLEALRLTKKYSLANSAHVILGLPGETKEDQMQTAKTLALLQIEGVKIHMLIAMKNTLLEQDYLQGLWEPLTLEDYVSLVCDFLERLHPECTIHRLSGNGHPLHTVAPSWVYDKKKEITQKVYEELVRRKSKQGFLYSCP